MELINRADSVELLQVLHIDGPPGLHVHILAQQQNKSRYGQYQDADAAPEVDDEEVLPHSRQYINNHLAHPHR